MLLGCGEVWDIRGSERIVKVCIPYESEVARRRSGHYGNCRQTTGAADGIFVVIQRRGEIVQEDEEEASKESGSKIENRNISAHMYRFRPSAAVDGSFGSSIQDKELRV